MRLLFVIPHYYRQHEETEVSGHRYGSERDRPECRADAFRRCVLSLHQHFGAGQESLNIGRRCVEPANQRLAAVVHIVICTNGRDHLLDRLAVDVPLIHHQPADVEPRLLGFQCRRELRDRWGNYDYYGYLEDDLVLHDSSFFQKLGWFNQHVGDDRLLLPNRYEVGDAPLPRKLYVDGDLAARVTERFQNVSEHPQLEGSVLGRSVVFRRPLNPHAGCYFLNARQMGHWIQRPDFAETDTSFIGPLESAATLGIMRAFKIYKPARENASFLEIQHAGTAFLDVAHPR